MELSDVDFENKLWTLPADKSKMNIKIIRPLAPQAISILKEQVELFSEFTRFVFPSATYQNAISPQTINKFCRAVRNRMNLESWTVHDFRRSISTILVDEGIEPYITEKLLGHSLGGVFSIYNKSNFITEQLSAYTQWEDILTK
jgi:integrase